MRILEQINREIGEAIDAVWRSVVHIRCIRTKKGLFRNESVEMTGAGVIFSSDGAILTNHHVVAEAESVTVTLQDGRRFDPECSLEDPVSDLAVLRISAQDLPAVKLDEGRSARLGEIVIAVGHPLSFDSSVSIGIVSAVARMSMDFPGKLPRVYIQTDAAINQGNSGGPLISSDGTLLGIVTFGCDPREGSGLGFAVPSVRAIKTARKLLESGSVRYGNIGLSGIETDLPAKAAKDHNLAQSTGLFVLSIATDGSAAQAGLHETDWIVNIADRPITTLESYMDVLDDESLIGQKARVKLLRGMDYSWAERDLHIQDLFPGDAEKA